MVGKPDYTKWASNTLIQRDGFGDQLSIAPSIVMTRARWRPAASYFETVTMTMDSSL